MECRGRRLILCRHDFSVYTMMFYAILNTRHKNVKLVIIFLPNEGDVEISLHENESE